eukprot:scaffold4358_cov137-Isochrysis_galbana.AAC.11
MREAALGWTGLACATHAPGPKRSERGAAAIAAAAQPAATQPAAAIAAAQPGAAQPAIAVLFFL